MTTEVLNTFSGVPGEAAPEGHEAEVLARVAAKEAELAGVGQDEPKQELLLGKFKSQEELARAYQELEKKLSQPKQQEQQQKAPEMTEEKAEELLRDSKVDLESMSDFYAQNGGLSEEHYNQLAQAGIPKEYVDQYIRSVEMEAEAARDQILTEVGGQEQFGVMVQWALANMSPQELQEYNNAVDSGDMAIVRSAVMSLAYRYQREAGREPNLVGGQAGGASGYESVAQLTAAMKDPRYGTDPAYRREVEQRLARSNIF